MKGYRDGGGGGSASRKRGNPRAGVMGDKLVHRLMQTRLGNPVQDPELVTIDSPAEETNSLRCGRGLQRTQSRASVPQRPKLCAPLAIASVMFPAANARNYLWAKAESQKIDWGVSV
jgi:hypothetical protein